MPTHACLREAAWCSQKVLGAPLHSRIPICFAFVQERPGHWVAASMHVIHQDIARGVRSFISSQGLRRLVAAVQVQEAYDTWRQAGERMEQLGLQAQHHRRWKSCQRAFEARSFALHRSSIGPWSQGNARQELA